MSRGTAVWDIMFSQFHIKPYRTSRHYFWLNVFVYINLRVVTDFILCSLFCGNFIVLFDHKLFRALARQVFSFVSYKRRI
jgi:hypothetical protein